MAAGTAGKGPFPGFIDLASERLGGRTLAANDEFFAPKENLLKPGRGIFVADKYTDRGKWMDGWETRRRRTPGHDWCVIRLGLPGILRGVDIDTNHFLGNHPQFASLDALTLNGEDLPAAGEAIGQLPWANVMPQSPLAPGSQNLFDVVEEEGRLPRTHLRLNIFPDGGVARFRAYGEVVPDWSRYSPGELIDLVAVENGGVPLVCSDMFFSPMHNIIMPGPALNMGDGWETKRRRGPGHDWMILRLGASGVPKKIEIDTTHFKGNYPESCSLDACCLAPAPDTSSAGHEDSALKEAEWTEVLPRTALRADTRHLFEKEVVPVGACTHVRLNIYPDGGVSRLRVWGTLGS